MPTCPKCGERIIPNTSFCVNCGEPIGEISEGGQEIPSFLQQATFGEIMEKAFNTIKGMIVAPISTVQMEESDFQVPIMLAVILGVIQGLLAIVIVNSATGMLFGFLGVDWMMDYITPSYGKIFLCIFFATLLAMLLLSIGLYLIGMYVFQGKGDGLQIWSVVVKAGVPVTVSLLCAFLLAYISSALSIMFFLTCGILLSALCVYDGIKKVTGLSSNRTVYTVSFSYLIGLLVVMSFLKSLL